MDAEKMRAELAQLARTNARLKHARGDDHNRLICELCAKAEAARLASERLALTASIVQIRSENVAILVGKIQRLTGQVKDASMVYPKGEPKANERIRQAETVSPMLAKLEIENEPIVTADRPVRTYRWLVDIMDRLCKTMRCDDWEPHGHSSIRFLRHDSNGNPIVIKTHTFGMAFVNSLARS